MLASLLLIAVVAALVGASTWAYFSDVETSEDNTFTAGTMDLKINDGAPDEWDDGASATWVSPDGWAPGATVNATLRVKNVGSVDAVYFYVDLRNLTPGGGIDNVQSEPELAVGGENVNDLASHIFVTWFEIKIDGWTVGNWAPWIADWGPFKADGAGLPLTLNELVDDIYGPMVTNAGVVGANEANEIQVIMTFQFDPDADNNYQGDQCSFDVGVAAGTGPPTYFWKAGEGSKAYGYGSAE